MPWSALINQDRDEEEEKEGERRNKNWVREGRMQAARSLINFSALFLWCLMSKYNCNDEVHEG